MTDIRTAHEIAREVVRVDTVAQSIRGKRALAWLETRERLVDERYIRLRQELPWTAQQAA